MAEYARPTKDLVHLTQFPVLLLHRLHLLVHFGQDARALTAVNLRPLDPLVQGLGCEPDLRGTRHHRLSP